MCLHRWHSDLWTLPLKRRHSAAHDRPYATHDDTTLETYCKAFSLPRPLPSPSHAKVWQPLSRPLPKLPRPFDLGEKCRIGSVGLAFKGRNTINNAQSLQRCTLHTSEYANGCVMQKTPSSATTHLHVHVFSIYAPWVQQIGRMSTRLQQTLIYASQGTHDSPTSIQKRASKSLHVYPETEPSHTCMRERRAMSGRLSHRLFVNSAWQLECYARNDLSETTSYLQI